MLFSQKGETGVAEVESHSDLLHAVVEAWDGLIYVGTSDFRILFLNSRFIDLLGRDATGEYCFRALHGRDDPCPWCMQEVFQGQKVRNRFKGPRDGLWYDVLNVPLPFADGVFAKVAFIRESSEEEASVEELPVFCNLIGLLTDAVFLQDPEDGRVLYANDTACRHLGYSRDELLTMKTEDFSEAVGSKGAWRDLVARIEKEGRVLLETHFRRRDGTFSPVEVNATSVQMGLQQVIVSVSRDITERKRAENRLVEERNMVEAIMAAIGEGITVQDRDYRIIYQNEVILRRLGPRLGELCYQAYMNRDSICEDCQMEKSLADGRIHRRQFTVERSGDIFHREASACPLRDADGHVVGCVEVVRDITEQKIMERSREEVFSVVSHEMRTPLTAIKGFAEYLAENKASLEEQRYFLGRMVKESARLQALIDNLLSFQRLRAGFGLDAPGPVEIPALLAEVAENYRSLLTSQRIEFECSPDHPPVYGEGEKIRLALENLLGNAIKYSPPVSKIVFGAKVHGSASWLWVRDEGPGIPADKQEKIFERFYRLGRRQGPAGTGLGLALVREIARAHGGWAWVESEPGKGAVFYLSLPLASEKKGSKPSKRASSKKK